MALLSPGVQVTVTDKSIYTAAAAPTVPLFFVATKYGKLRPNSNLVAKGTIEAGVPRLITSLRESLEYYGMPVFYRDAYDQPHHGDCRNEYGLLALNQYLSLGNRAYVIRADIDLDDDPENIQYLWQTATSKVVDKAKALFNVYLSQLQELKGDDSLNRIGGFKDRPANWDTVYQTNTDGSIKLDSNGAPLVQTAGMTYDDKVKWFQESADVFSQNKKLEEIISRAVEEIIPLTSTFADKYTDYKFAKYNLRNILAGNFFDVLVDNSESILNPTTGQYEPKPVYDYSDYVDPASELVQHNLLISNMARKYAATYKYSVSASEVPLAHEYIDNASMFKGLVGEMNAKIHDKTIGGTFELAITLNATDIKQVNDSTKMLSGNITSSKITCEISSIAKSINFVTDKTYVLTAKNTLTFSNSAGNYVGNSTSAFSWDGTTLKLLSPIVIENIQVAGTVFKYTFGVTGDNITTLAGTSVTNIVTKTTGNTTAKDGFTIVSFADMIKDSLERFANTYSFYFSTHPLPKVQLSTSKLLNTGKDSVRRQEVVKKLAQVIRSNTTTNLDLDPAFASTADITSDGYEFNLILCPGFPELADEMLELSTRIKQEAFVIADTPMDKSPRDVVRWGGLQDENTVQASYNIIRSDNRGLIAYYYPHGIVSNLDGYDVMCAASGLALAAMTNSDNVSYPWYAPAGPNRGLLTATTGVSQVGFVEGDIGTSNVNFSRVRLNDTFRDALYNQCNINPINDSLQYGVMVLGQKTRVNLAFNSALDRINVARMVMYARRGLRKLLYRYLMEPNTQQTRKNVVSAVTSFLDNIKTKQGLYDFAVLCDDSNNTPDSIDRNELIVEISLKPTKAIEFVYCEITLLRTGDPLTF